MSLHFAQIGNFGPEHSTENEVRKAIVANDHEVSRIQEDDADQWANLIAGLRFVDVICWTRTASLSPDHDTQNRLLAAARAAGTPVIGLHLDRWHGLRRQREIATEPFFTVDVLFTADGGHDAEWAAAGVNHRWLPPAVSEFECVPGTPRDEYRSPVAFVGSWQGGYHGEWPHRQHLVRWLRRHYRDAVHFWPKPGEHAVRGEALRDLYASVDVLVGDSCLVPKTDGSPCVRYWSDRVPESLGRGGFLIHPWVDGIREQHPGLTTWQLGDWDALRSAIDRWLDDPDGRAELAEINRAHVLARHTYTVRVRQVVEQLVAEGLLAKEAA